MQTNIIQSIIKQILHTVQVENNDNIINEESIPNDAPAVNIFVPRVQYNFLPFFFTLLQIPREELNNPLTLDL